MAMHASLARLAMVLMLALSSPAGADELADFNAAVERAAAHQRVALGYLRTGNIDPAVVEIERMRLAWATVSSRFIKPPAALSRDPGLYTATMADIATRLVAASIMADSGRIDAARDSLTAIRAELTALRKANGIVVLADCIGDANAAAEQLLIFDDPIVDLRKPDIATTLADKASAYGHIISRCDAMASAEIRIAPEFRRLVDGAQNALAQIPGAIANRDADLLHRLFGELRSLDNLLAFRFG
jgi:hypothetical protein